MKLPEQLKIQKIDFPNLPNLGGAIDEALPVPSLNTENLSPSFDGGQASKTLIHLADQIWRIGTVVLDSDSGEAKAELSPRDIRKVSNAVEAVREAIQRIGIRVIDRCNQDFDPGLPDQVVTEEPMEGISKERIIRTIRPTIMWHQTMVQRGEIDIAVPAQTKNTEPSSTEP